jgi:hypothetical protein
MPEAKCDTGGEPEVTRRLLPHFHTRLTIIPAISAHSSLIREVRKPSRLERHAEHVIVGLPAPLMPVSGLLRHHARRGTYGVLDMSHCIWYQHSREGMSQDESTIYRGAVLRRFRLL